MSLSRFRAIPELIRLNVSLAVTLSAFSAFIAAYGQVTWKTILPVAGIFFLAAGASALNQYQEREQDSKMSRTCSRPVPSGRILPGYALGIACVLLVTGLLCLSYENFWIPVSLGILNVLWYNGFYTWLKQKTAFAVVPGALTGVIPLLMGWTAAGGSLSEHRILFLSFFLFMWQIPHFWLLMLQYGEEYRSAGFPAITDIFTIRQVKNIIISWIIGASGSSMLLILSGLIQNMLSKFLIAGMNAILLLFFLYALLLSGKSRFRMLFVFMNAFLLLVLCILIADRILR